MHLILQKNLLNMLNGYFSPSHPKGGSTATTKGGYLILAST
jgi:hypothetical protein